MLKLKLLLTLCKTIKIIFMEKLIKIQGELKAPKKQFNSFGKYSYRSAEDILEAVKPLLVKEGLLLTISDEPILVGERVYILATVTVSDGEKEIKVQAVARESETKKGMDDSQITGAASSYARKYALNGMFCIDDSKDVDNYTPESKELTPLSHKWKEAIKHLKENKSIAIIKKHYILSEENEKKLKDEAGIS